MKMRNSVIIITSLIALLSIVSSAIGIFSHEMMNVTSITSVNGQIVELYGIGIYWRDSISIASQGIGSDVVTLFIAIPWFIVSLIMYTKKSFIGNIMLTGLSGYFLYTYMSYTFLWMYNPLFLLYVALMSLSLFNLVMLFADLDLSNILVKSFKRFPVKRLAYFEITIGILVSMMWLSMIIPNLIDNTIPIELEHYTTLVIQGMDLGILLPLSIVAGILLLKRKAIGYVISFILLVKSVMMLLSINAMSLNQLLHAVEVDPISLLIFSLAAVFAISILIETIVKESRDSVALLK